MKLTYDWECWNSIDTEKTNYESHYKYDMSDLIIAEIIKNNQHYETYIENNYFGIFYSVENARRALDVELLARGYRVLKDRLKVML